MEEITKIPNREEIPVEDTWATEDMYPGDEAWEAELATLEGDKALLSGFAGHLADSAEKLLDYLINMERVDSKADLLGNYCMRKADQDTREAKYQAMSGKLLAPGGPWALPSALEPQRSLPFPDKPWASSIP